MEIVTVFRDGKTDLQFEGEEVARHVSNKVQGRWQDLALYRTKKGRWVCERVGRTQWQGEFDRYEGAPCSSVAQVIEFFGLGGAAKELYVKAGITVAEDPDEQS